MMSLMLFLTSAKSVVLNATAVVVMLGATTGAAFTCEHKKRERKERREEDREKAGREGMRKKSEEKETKEDSVIRGVIMMV